MDEELKTKAFITHVPVNAVKVIITAKILDDNLELHEAVMDLNQEDIINGFIDGDYWEAENVKYVLTEKGEELLNEK